jgi:hypothetical protein
VNLVRPAQGAIVGPTFEIELQLTGETKNAEIEVATDAATPVLIRRYSCVSPSCRATFQGPAKSYQVRGWAVIDRQRYETPYHRVTVDPTPLLAQGARLRSPDVIEVRFSEPVAPSSLPTGVQVLRRVPVSASSQQDVTDSPPVQTELEDEGRTLVIRGAFGAPAFLSLGLDVTDAHGAWRNQESFELTQSYFQDVTEVVRDAAAVHTLLFDAQGRAIVSWTSSGIRTLVRREADGSWTDLIANDALAPCLQDGYSDGDLLMDSQGRLVALCGITGQVARREAEQWVALGPPLSSRAAGVSLAVDGQDRPVAMVVHLENNDYRVSVQRYENGSWTLLSGRLNAPDKHIVVTAGLIPGADKALMVTWDEGNVAQGSQARAVQVTETGTAPLSWAEDLRLSTHTAEDGADGVWLAAQEVSTHTHLILRLKPSATVPEVVARGVGLSEVPVLWRHEDGHLAMFGRRWEQLNGLTTVMMTLERLEGGVWEKFPDLNSDILERATVDDRIVVKAARAPDGVLHALVVKSWRDTSTRPPALRQALWLVRR